MGLEKSKDVTALLDLLASGDLKARDRLFEAVYRELHRMAHRLVALERPGHTLQTTGVVHEAYLRLAQGKVLKNPQNRRYFFGAAAKAMREVLRDYAQQRRAQKRGGDWQRLPLDDVMLRLPGLEDVGTVPFSEALEGLEQADDRWYQIVVLRVFGGLSQEEIAEHLELSLSTVEKEWRAAKAWLGRELRHRQSSRGH